MKSCRIYRWLKQFYLKRSDLKLENTYICNKKKEFGKWLMDIAKYITTAVILSSMIGDIRGKRLSLHYSIYSCCRISRLGIIFS